MSNVIIPMIYTRPLSHPDILASGNYKGFNFYVLTMGTHPCAYIEVTGTVLHGIDYMDLYCTGIDVHGGFTYSSYNLSCVSKESDGLNRYFIGWDYAHYGDKICDTSMYFDGISPGKQWSTLEIMCDCRNAILQIIKYLGGLNNDPNRMH